MVFKRILLFYKDAGKQERALLRKLFKDYDPLERPVENETHTLEVKVGMAIQQVIDLVCILCEIKNNEKKIEFS